jgi:flagellar secretion chaperone FliS
MTYTQVAATYQRNAILNATPEKLIKLLYDGAIKNLERSRIGLTDSKTARSPEVGQALSRAMGILGELRASLDHAAGGEVARDLDRLYEFGLDQLGQSNLTRTPAGVTNTLKVMRTLQEGWNAVIPG